MSGNQKPNLRQNLKFIREKLPGQTEYQNKATLALNLTVMNIMKKYNYNITTHSNQSLKNLRSENNSKFKGISRS